MTDCSVAAASTSLLAAAFHCWRSEALASQVFLLHERLADLQAECERLHHSKQLQKEALTSYFDRRPSSRRVVESNQRLALLTWQRRTQRQVAVQSKWRDLADAALALDAESDEGGMIQGASVAQRLWCRRRQRSQPASGGLALALAERMQTAACVGVWREVVRIGAAWRRVRQREEQLECLSAGLPAWVGQVGDRRRLERAWLALRLTACHGGPAKRRPRQQPPIQQQPWVSDLDLPEEQTGAFPPTTKSQAAELHSLRPAPVPCSRQAAVNTSKHPKQPPPPPTAAAARRHTAEPDSSSGGGALGSRRATADRSKPTANLTKRRASAFGHTIAADEWQPLAAASKVPVSTPLILGQAPGRQQQEGMPTSAPGGAAASGDRQHRAAGAASVVCSSFIDIRGSLKTVRDEVTSQTQALFSGGGNAVLQPLVERAAAVDYVGAFESLSSAAAATGVTYPADAAAIDYSSSTPVTQQLPQMAALPGAVTVDYMGAVTDGLHAAARPWLRRTAAEAAADAGATQAVGAIPDWPPAVGGLSSTTEDHQRSQLQGDWGQPKALSVAAVDTRPPTAPPQQSSPGFRPLQHSEQTSPLLASLPFAAAAGSPVASVLAAGSAAEQWRVVGQPRSTTVVSPPQRRSAGSQRPDHQTERLQASGAASAPAAVIKGCGVVRFGLLRRSKPAGGLGR
jgi:hypothetical protein